MKKLLILSVAAFTCMAFQTAPKKQLPAKPVAVNAANTVSASIQRGKQVYTTTCLACHQVDGGGVPHLNPPLDGATGVIGKDKIRLVRIVLKGLDERVELDGEYYSNNMAAHADLSNQQIADVLTYIRNSWTNKAGAVTLAEVKAARAKIK
jgi:mono/diheme cytochrome c family protein